MAGPLRTVTPVIRRPTFGVLPGVAGVGALPSNARDQELYVFLSQIANGKLNNTAEVTLEVDPATTTVVSDPRIQASSVVLLSPLTANAAAALATTYVVPGVGSVTIHHTASVQIDRTFRIAVFA